MELIPTRRAQRLEDSLPLEELTELVRGRARSSADYPDIPLTESRMEEDGRWRFNGHAGRLTDHAFRQLCARLPLPGGSSAPAAYLARCPAPLAAPHLNHWIAQAPPAADGLLVRTQQREDGAALVVRAVLSRRYALADHLPLLELLERLLPSTSLTVQAWSWDDERLTLRLLLNEDHPASLADPLRVGLHIANSEIGLGRVSIHALVTRLVCRNGLVVRIADLGGVERRHIGRAGEDLYVLARIGLTRVLAEAEEAARRFVALRQQPAPRPVEAFLRRAAWDAEMPLTLLPETVVALEGDSLYDVVNALTRVAQRLPVAERIQAETAVSRFLRAGGNGR
jgi:hypothetical protein